MAPLKFKYTICNKTPLEFYIKLINNIKQTTVNYFITRKKRACKYWYRNSKDRRQKLTKACKKNNFNRLHNFITKLNYQMQAFCNITHTQKRAWAAVLLPNFPA